MNCSVSDLGTGIQKLFRVIQTVDCLKWRRRTCSQCVGTDAFPGRCLVVNADGGHPCSNRNPSNVAGQDCRVGTAQLAGSSVERSSASTESGAIENNCSALESTAFSRWWLSVASPSQVRTLRRLAEQEVEDALHGTCNIDGSVTDVATAAESNQCSNCHASQTSQNRFKRLFRQPDNLSGASVNPRVDGLHSSLEKQLRFFLVPDLVLSAERSR